MFLNCHSYFSLNYGILSVEELLQYAKETGITHLALTDINNTSGIIQIGNGQDVEVRQRGEGNISVVVQSGYN